jgi:hypothetical protein
MSTSFQISFPEVTLGIEEIWPDGDAPFSPTTEDVIAKMKETSEFASTVVDRWNLFRGDFEVNGRPFK